MDEWWHLVSFDIWRVYTTSASGVKIIMIFLGTDKLCCVFTFCAFIIPQTRWLFSVTLLSDRRKWARLNYWMMVPGAVAFICNCWSLECGAFFFSFLLLFEQVWHRFQSFCTWFTAQERNVFLSRYPKISASFWALSLSIWQKDLHFVFWMNFINRQGILTSVGLLSNLHASDLKFVRNPRCL